MSSKVKAELDALSRKSEEDIDLEDIPETDGWEGAEQGKFYRPVKSAISIRLDADVIEWFRAQEGPYQTRINEVLRRHVAAQRRGER